MQVTKSNFKQSLPLVTDAINSATFLAIDAEFSGLDTGQTIHAFDTLQERYIKQRKAAKAFIIVQFGLSAFQYRPELDKYEVRSFNFYVCPRPFNRHAPDVRYQCQSGSIEFLSHQGLDFNKVFREGISYLLPSEVDRLKDTIVKRHEHQNSCSLAKHALVTSPVTAMSGLVSADNGAASPVVPPKDASDIPIQHQPFIHSVLEKVDNFVEKGDLVVLDLEPCNGFLRKLTYQSVQHKYGKKLRLESVNSDNRQHIRVTYAKTPEEFERMEKDRQNADYQELDDAVGFSKVIKLLSQSGKLIVGHNMILDMLHTIEHFISPLPESYEEFKDLFRCVFPRVLDTKVLASSEHLKDLLLNTTLADMQRDLEKMPFSKPKVVDFEDEVGYSNSSERLHEAGYDSYITGLCFISMTEYLGSTAKPPISRVEVDSAIVRQYWNKLYLMRMTDLSYINLEGLDAKLSRDHVFHLTFPESWKAENIHQLFSPFGNVQIAWLDEKTAFVGLYRRDQASAAVRSLMSTSDRVYRLMTYNQFSAVSPSAITSTPASSVTDTPNSGGHSSNKRKLSASDVGVSSPVIGSRKKSGRFSVGSCDIPPIPEEDVDEVENSEAADSSAASEDKKLFALPPVNKKPRISCEKSSGTGKIFEEPTEW